MIYWKDRLLDYSRSHWTSTVCQSVIQKFHLKWKRKLKIEIIYNVATVSPQNREELILEL